MRAAVYACKNARTRTWIKAAGLAGLSSGGGLGDGLLVCPCAFALVSSARLAGADNVSSARFCFA